MNEIEEMNEIEQTNKMEEDNEIKETNEEKEKENKEEEKEEIVIYQQTRNYLKYNCFIEDWENETFRTQMKMNQLMALVSVINMKGRFKIVLSDVNGKQFPQFILSDDNKMTPSEFMQFHQK